MLIRKKLTAAEFSNPNLRYNSACDCVQFTPDGGDTWIDQPANDPRTSDAYRLPALTGDDTQCRAAEGMTALIRAFVDQRINFDTDAELAAAILGIVAFIPGFNVMYALLLAFVGLAIAIARELLEAAFTESVYDQLRCIFYCNIDTDGQMSQGQFDQVIVAVHDFDFLVEVWVINVMNLVGAVGMSDAGVALEAAADCDECACTHCFTIDFEVTDGSAEGWTAQGGTYGSGAWSGIYLDPSNQNDLWGYWAFPEILQVSRIEMEFYKAYGSGGNDANNMRSLYPTATGYSTTGLTLYADNPKVPDVRQTKVILPNTLLAGVGIDLNTGSEPNAVQIYRWTVFYSGDVPLGWTDNCD